MWSHFFKYQNSTVTKQISSYFNIAVYKPNSTKKVKKNGPALIL